MLRDLALKAVYRSETDNLLEDFYIPALSNSVAYDRAVGFFSASMISLAAQGLGAFLKNRGRMRLIVGGELESEDANAIQQGYHRRAITEKVSLLFLAELNRIVDALCYRRLEALSWMIAEGSLDIKVALKPKGMYHEKIGILTDGNGDRIVFQGSANETAHALLPDFNFESLNVFQTWRPELRAHYEPYLIGFEDLWNGRSKQTLVLEFPEAARERLVRIAAQARLPSSEIEIDLFRRLKTASTSGSSTAKPALPLTLHGATFGMLDHQTLALQSWKANGFTGILALCTGAGKTIAAIYGAVRVLEAWNRLVVIIAVPYQSLADQWVDELQQFNIYPVRCYASSSLWRTDLNEQLLGFASGTLNFLAIVVVNKTLQSRQFQDSMRRVPGDLLLFVGDECHHHRAPGLSQSLPAQAKLRLGLSATPGPYGNQGGEDPVQKYYGSIVATYDLRTAIEVDKVLTPYYYRVSVVDLTAEEVEAYDQLSDQLTRLISECDADRIEHSEDDRVKYLLLKRARLLGSASNKLAALKECLSGKPPEPLTLFYCGDGTVEDEDTGEALRHVESVSRLLHSLGWRSCLFTARESRQERIQILNHFRAGLIDALVAIRCLDEGIDVPACRTAYILASSRNPKQFVQRRGRILRRAPGKEFAVVHDLVIRIPEAQCRTFERERNLFAAELRRVSEFARLALNYGEVLRTLEPMLRQYDLWHRFG